MNINQINKAKAKFNDYQIATFKEQGSEFRRNYQRVTGLLMGNGFSAAKNVDTDNEYAYYELGSVLVAVPYIEDNSQVLFDCDVVEMADLDQLRELTHAAYRANRESVVAPKTEWLIYA